MDNALEVYIAVTSGRMCICYVLNMLCFGHVTCLTFEWGTLMLSNDQDYSEYFWVCSNHFTLLQHSFIQNV